MAQRVGDLVIAVVKRPSRAGQPATTGQTESPEVEVFDEFTPKIKKTYGSAEYKGFLTAFRRGA